MRLSSEIKVGLFALVTLVLIAYGIVRLSDRGGFGGGTTRVSAIFDTAQGLTRKTPVEVAGIQIGFIEKLDLEGGRKARALLRIDRRVRLGKNAAATVRTKGFLGETYVDLDPGDTEKGETMEGGQITVTNQYVDVNRLAADTERVIARLEGIIGRNEENIHDILEGFAGISQDLREILGEKKAGLSETMDRIASISRKVDEGRGALGRLVNDDEIAESINEAARGVSETIGGINRFQFELGYHLEFLGETNDFKNYVALNLKPRPDKYFIVEFVLDPNPSPVRTLTTTNETVGGVETTTVTEESMTRLDDLLISAEFAKTFYDFTFRGGVIESSGGLGIDWRRGPVGIELSAFDFRTDNNQRPHLKALGRLKLTKNLFLLSGVDDIISRQQDPDWFVGAGLSLIDEDIRTLFGAASLAATRSR